MSPLRRLWNVVRRSRIDDELRQELDTHLGLLEEEERREGLTAEQARQNARTGSATRWRTESARSMPSSRRGSRMRARTSASPFASCARRRDSRPSQ
jgi:hypothetical protein